MRVTHPRRPSRVCAALALALSTTALGADGGAPRVVADAPVYDFGTVEQGDVVEHVFRLRNTGAGALRVDHVKGTCACTVGVATGEPILPGDEAWVTVRLDTTRLAGRTTKAVAVYTNDPASPTVGVTLTGEVLTDLVVTPPVVYFGRVRRGGTTRREVTLVPGRRNGTAAAVTVDSPDPHVRASLAPADGGGQRLSVELDADMPLGHFDDELTLRTTSARRPTLAVPVIGTVEGDIAVLPAQVTFGVSHGEAVEPRELAIRNRGPRPIAVTRVTVPDAVTYDLATVQDGVEYRLSLRLRDGLPPGKIEGSVEIFTDHPQENRVVIPLYAVVRSSGRHG
jgi:hypothetical protein